jgi:hypothetical protein
MRDRVEKGRADTLVAPERRGALPRTQAAAAICVRLPDEEAKERRALIPRDRDWYRTEAFP